MKLTLDKIQKVFSFVILVVVFTSLGYFFGATGFQGDFRKFPIVKISRIIPPTKNLDFSLFWKVWDTLSMSYYDNSKIVPSKMVYGAIKGMVESVGDPYTSFLPPDDNKITQEDLSGNFEGIGIQIGFKNQDLVIISPLVGSPAEKAGVKAGDFIIGIKDNSKKVETGTSGISLTDAVKLIRGPAGTSITLSLMRKGSEKPLVLEVTRQVINVPSVVVTYKGLNKSIAVIALTKFSADTNNEWEKIVSEVVAKGNLVKGIVLDLRNNPGGYLDSSVNIASEFIKSGIIVIEDNGKGEMQEIKVSKVGKMTGYPLVVLINSGSASASEILAGALRDNNTTKLIGETSFGKGTVQEPLQIEGGSSLHVTTSKWLTPKSVWVNEKGLEPDIKITDNDKTPNDEQLDEAINFLSKT